MAPAILTMSQNQQYSSAQASTGKEPLETIVLRLQRGEETALEDLIARTEGACRRLALSILRDPELSEDALQETYLIVYQRIQQLRDPSAVKTWLFRILTRCCREMARKKSREVESDVEATERADQEILGVSSPTDPAARVARREKIRNTFEQLPEIDRTALALREIANLSYQEMAATLSVPVGTIRSRLAKARKRFIATYKGVKK